jgi:hypothetical protein
MNTEYLLWFAALVVVAGAALLWFAIGEVPEIPVDSETTPGSAGEDGLAGTS